MHAKRYACMGDEWSYETELPEWSLPPPGVDGPTMPTEESDPLAGDMAKLGLEDDVKSLEAEKSKEGEKSKDAAAAGKS